MTAPIVDARAEAAKAGKYPARKFNKRTDKVIESVLNSTVLAESVTWDFAVQGGAAGTVALGQTLPANAIVTGVYCSVVTALTGAGTIKLAAGASDLTQTLSSSSTGVVTSTVAAQKIASTAALNAVIATGLTAGKVTFYVTFLLP